MSWAIGVAIGIVVVAVLIAVWDYIELRWPDRMP